VYPISFACYYSGFEYYNIVIDYFLTLIDLNKLFYNLFHNAGPLYDTFTDLIANFRFGDPDERIYWQRIGNDIGFMLN